MSYFHLFWIIPLAFCGGVLFLAHLIFVGAEKEDDEENY